MVLIILSCISQCSLYIRYFEIQNSLKQFIILIFKQGERTNTRRGTFDGRKEKEKAGRKEKEGRCSEKGLSRLLLLLG